MSPEHAIWSAERLAEITRQPAHICLSFGVLVVTERPRGMLIEIVHPIPAGPEYRTNTRFY